MPSESPKLIMCVVALGALLLLAGCARHSYDRFNAMGGLVSDWPQFTMQSVESNLLLGKQPVDPPSAYRDQ